MDRRALLEGHISAQGSNAQVSWVISGGVGALGSLMATWLCLAGAKQSLLLSRSGHTSSQAALLQGLMSSLQLVTVARCPSHLVFCDALTFPSSCASSAGKMLHALTPRSMPHLTVQGGHGLSK